MRKLFSTAAIFILINLSLFAESGFEGIFNIPLGLSAGIPMGTKDNTVKKIGLGFDIGITAQFGYIVDFKNGVGLSILGEAGYSYDTYAYTIPSSDKSIKNLSSISFHSLQVGLLPKINIKDFSIGIGGGLKIPIAGTIDNKTTTYGTNYTAEGYNVNILDIVNEYDKMNVIPYVKLTFDYSVFNDYNVAANFGLYFDYEFGTRKKIDEKTYTSVDSFGAGLQIGLRFSPFKKLPVSNDTNK
ncbi:outer membrane beta-barrel protein [Brachyspira murdochii]|uniref:Serpentine_recp domain containing protein n=2 Tax=Brachyspira murdochii TaxID=84378 RepID=D5U5Z0_BRAM5|nr:outer membrane beta-barrel protein [Brachyspira murdochii]ADG70481.1 conserved hypothetical protein [Brachyspira murdochii DSM 12563]PPS21393.1 hypothetical protein DJ52_11100 [Brachyspira murdochii]